MGREVAQQLAGALQQLDEQCKTQAIVESLAQIGSFSWSIGIDSVRWSTQAEAIFAAVPDGAPPSLDAYLQLVHPDDRAALATEINSAIQEVREYELVHRMILGDEIRDIRSRGRVERGPHGPLVTGSLQDMTEVDAASRALRESRDLFAAVLDAATQQLIIATDADGLITVFNTGAERLLGYTAAEMIGRSPAILHDPADVEMSAAKLAVAPSYPELLAKAAESAAEDNDWTYLTRDGRQRHLLVTVSSMRDADDAISGYITVGTDITEQIRAQSELVDSESRFRDTFEYAPHGMMLVDVSPENPGRFIRVNPALCQLTGFSEADLLTMGVADLTHPDSLELYRCRFASLANGSVKTVAIESHWCHADSHDLWVQLSISPMRTDRAPFVIGQVEDITARKYAEARLTHQALHDGLTGLPNRLLLMDRIQHALANADGGRRMAVLCIDLDGFKAVNDTGGHAAGDNALIELAQRIRGTLRPGDTVARLGGDEFVVVCEELDDDTVAITIAERILRAIRVPHSYGGHTFTLGASIGVSVATSNSTPEQLLREADLAMYEGKGAGKGVVVVANPDNVNPAFRPLPMHAVRLETELDAALTRAEFVLHGQTIHDLTTGSVVAVENLLRWQHPTRGLLRPNHFLDVAESTELMIPIGRWVIDESCRMARTWHDALGSAAPVVHVNISGRQLENGVLRTDVCGALARHGLPPANLVLELTETHTPLLEPSIRRDLAALRAMGVQLAIDDLGTGYSSLARLTELPVDLIKIDVGFVAQMGSDAASRAVVRGILAIGHSLGLCVVGEGIETVTQAEQLRRDGCDSAQGYFYSHPRPEAELLHALIRAQHPSAARLPKQPRQPVEDIRQPSALEA